MVQIFGWLMTYVLVDRFAAKGLNEYEVVIQTGDKRAAGTDANVFLAIEG